MKMNDLFTSNSHWKLITYLAMNDTSEMNLGDLSAECGLSKAMSSITLRELESAGFVEKKKIGNSHIYRTVDSPVLRSIKKVIGLVMILDSGIIEKILEIDPDVNTIALFGSFAKGEQIVESDIDLLILTSSKKDLFLALPESVQERTLNVVTFSPGTWYRLKRENDPFHGSVLEDHLIIHGSEIS